MKLAIEIEVKTPNPEDPRPVGNWRVHITHDAGGFTIRAGSVGAKPTEAEAWRAAFAHAKMTAENELRVA